MTTRRTAARLVGAALATTGLGLLLAAGPAATQDGNGWGPRCGGPCPTVPETTVEEVTTAPPLETTASIPDPPSTVATTAPPSTYGPPREPPPGYVTTVSLPDVSLIPPIVVDRPPVADPPPVPEASPELARTGSRTHLLVTVAVGLIAAGALAFRLSRRVTG
jgi:hypothetical protein